MPLPTYGPLSMGEIGLELGRSDGQIRYEGVSLGQMSNEAGLNHTPYFMSEFYGYASSVDIQVKSIIQSGVLYSYIYQYPLDTSLSSPASIRTYWSVTWVHNYFGYTYSETFMKDYTFSDPGDIYTNSALPIYQSGFTPYLSGYSNIDLDDTDSANIINV